MARNKVKSPRIQVTMPQAVMSRLEQYAQASGDAMASAAAKFIENKLEQLEDSGKLDREQKIKQLEQQADELDQELTAVIDFILLLIGDDVEVDFSQIANIVDRPTQELERLQQQINRIRRNLV